MGAGGGMMGASQQNSFGCAIEKQSKGAAAAAAPAAVACKHEK